MRKLWLGGAVVAGAIVAVLVLAFGMASADDDDDEAQATPTSTLQAATSTPDATSTPVPTLTHVPSPTPPAPTSTPEPQLPPPATATSVPAPPPATPTLPPSPPTLEPGTQIVPAPIDGLDVLVLESFPPQYMVNIKAGLPSGCARKHDTLISRSGDTFTIQVRNTMPVGPVACTAIYGMYEVNQMLTGPFVSGTVYTVNVNDKTTTFTAQ